MDKTPILNWTIDELKDKMQKIGFSVEFIGKPRTIEDLTLTSRDNDIMVRVSNESRKIVRDYCSKEGDGAIILDSRIFSMDGKNRDYCDLTLQLYQLNPLDDEC